jgi:ketosteroid isomerase-like protein
MTNSNPGGDEAEVLALHHAFVEANKTADHPFLEAHMAPGMTLLWYNLNQSNYHGVDHIVELWKMLAGVMNGKPGTVTTRDDTVTIIGDAALVTYLIDLAADFGQLGKVAQEGRTTEVWQRMDGEWKMIHFHCSNYVPGVMGGN